MGMHLIGVYLTGIYLIGVYGHISYKHASYGYRDACISGVHLLEGGIIDNFSNDLCAKLPRTRIRLSPELALEIAPPIHSGFSSP